MTKKPKSTIKLPAKNIGVVANEFDNVRRPITGRDIINALASSPLADVEFERLSVKSNVRDITL